MSRYLIFALCSVPLILTAVSSTSVAVAFPVMTAAYNASLILAGWVLSVYQLVATAAMPLVGKASDLLGRRNTFVLCVSLFGFGSFLCAIAPNIYFLIMARVVQAVGGGGFMPSTAGIISDLFPDKRQQAIGFFTSIHTIGQIVGPSVGGWLITVYGWQSIFLVNIPLLTVVAVVAAFVIRPEPMKKTSMDLVGSGLFTCSVFSFMISLSMLGNTGAPVMWFLVPVLLVGSMIFMVSFVRRSAHVSNPVIDPVVLRHKPFLAANVYNFTLGACYFGMSSLAPLYAVSVYGLSTLASGLIVTPKALGMLASSTLTSLYLVRWGYRRPMLIGSVGVALALALMALEIPGLDILGFHVGGALMIPFIMALAGTAMGVLAPAANNACIELMPERVGTITGIRGMFRQTGGGISIAAGTLLLNNMGDIARGFQVLLFSLAALMLLAMPAIFMMPRSCQTPPPRGGQA